MEPINVDIRLIKAVLGTELRITPGRSLVARVVTADGLGRGSLNIAGAVIDASLPKDVQAGQELRLSVRYVSADRVELSMSDQSQPTVTGAEAVPLPGGGALRVTERDRGAGDGDSGPGESADRHSVTLRYDTPALGAIDLRFDLDSQSLRLSATVRAGEPYDLALDGAGKLADALTDAIARPVTVELMPRREPLDVYA
ncbi:MAG TPA: hypothetical protein VMA96_02275 [Solirubrobacteraceae bacterium]|nr:hypothetical protein [Solirubrobacteraceae bacterium]